MPIIYSSVVTSRKNKSFCIVRLWISDAFHIEFLQISETAPLQLVGGSFPQLVG